MQPAELFSELRRLLPSSDSPVVLRALKADPLVWSSVNRTELLHAIIREDSTQSENWSPAELGLRLHGCGFSAASLRADHMPAVDGSLRRKSLNALEVMMRTGKGPAELVDAFLVALALRERRRKTQTWDGLYEELSSLLLRAPASPPAVWDTVLACLYGMIPDPDSLLSALMTGRELFPGARWVTHCLLANPLEEDTQKKSLKGLLLLLSVDEQAAWLHHLLNEGSKSLVKSLAVDLLINNHDLYDEVQFDFDADSLVNRETVNRLVQNQAVASLHQLAGHPVQSGLYLEKVRAGLQHWLVGSTLQVSCLAAQAGKIPEEFQGELENIYCQLPASERLKTEGLFISKQVNDAILLANSHVVHQPVLARVFSAQKQASAGQLREAQEVAREAVDYWVRQVQESADGLQRQFVFDINPWPLLEALLELNLVPEAITVGKVLLKEIPEDERLLKWTAEWCHKIGDDSTALDLIYQLILLDPDNVENFRTLAEFLEDKGMWPEAIEERKRILGMVTLPALDDSLALVKCAYMGGLYPLARENCNKILVINPENGLAHAYLGMVNAKENLLEDGLASLSKATLLVPENPLPWLELAKLHREMGDPPRAVETLRAAILNVPDSADLQFALGNEYLKNGSATEALPFLRQSARLAPESKEVALSLAEALLSLGHDREALECVEKARRSWPMHGKLAYLHASILMDSGDRDGGISTLEMALQCENNEAAWFSRYARELLGEPQDYLFASPDSHALSSVMKAQKALQKALLMMNGDDFETRLMMAEVLAMRNENEAAFAAYHQLTESPEASQAKWYWRVQAGLGRTALSLDQDEIALAALQNALHAFPESTNLHRTLAEAYVKLSLADSAVQSAQVVLSQAPNDVSTLSWYAEIMERIGALHKGIDALKTATQCEPKNVHLAIRLALLSIKAGDRTSAADELLRATEISDISAEDLSRIADAAMQVSEPGLALIALEKAVNASSNDADGLLFKLACLYERLGKYEAALETIEKAVTVNPNRSVYYLLQSDLQAKLKRPQAALASLERVVRIKESLGRQGAERREDDLAQESWTQIPETFFDIHVRFSRLFLQVENLSSASFHAEKALELRPEHQEIRYLAIELAARLLQFEHASQMAEIPGLNLLDIGAVAQADQENLCWISGLLGLKAFLHLEQGAIQAAEQLVEIGLALQPENPLITALQARLLARQGDYSTGAEVFTRIYAQLFEKTTDDISENYLAAQQLDFVHLVLALAATELFQWKKGLDLLGIYTRQYSFEPLGMFLFIRELVRAAEWQAAGKEVNVTARIYPDDLLNDRGAARLNQLVADFCRISQPHLIERWQARGEAIFAPSAGHVRALGSIQIDAEDAAWLVFALKRTGNSHAALQIGEQFPQDGFVQALVASIQQDVLPEMALVTARRAVGLAPYHPYCQVVLAQCAEKLQDYNAAVEALEIALKMWPDEPVWHLWAAQIAEGISDFELALYHLERGAELAPTNLKISAMLGQYYLHYRMFEKAANILSDAVKIAPKDGRIWVLLAEAYQGLEKYNEALGAAEQAAAIDPRNLQSLALCGEVSLVRGDIEKALEYAQKAQALSPEDARTRLLAARILLREGKEKEALAELTAASADLPDAFEIHLEQAMLVYKLHGASQAVQILQKLAGDHPQDERVMRLLANAYLEIGDERMAEKAAVTALRINPYQPDLHLKLGRIYLNNGHLDKSVHHFSEAAHGMPEDITPLLELAKAYTIRREFSQALTAYQQAIQTSPEDYRPYYLAALVLRDGKDYPGAEAMLRRAAQLAPEDVNIRRTLGAIVALNLVQNCQEASACQ